MPQRSQRMNADVDTRALLPSIRVPTLIVHRVGDQNVDVKNARYAAEHIPGARYLELPGVDHLPWVGDSAAITRAFREFLEEVWRASARASGAGPRPDDGPLHGHRRLDREGGRARRPRLAASCSSSTTTLSARSSPRFRGRKSTRPGTVSLRRSTGPRGRSGVRARSRTPSASSGSRSAPACTRANASSSTGRWPASRFRSAPASPRRAGPGEVLVSQTVKDLVAGSGIEFADRGVAELKGVPGEWRLFAVESA